MTNSRFPSHVHSNDPLPNRPPTTPTLISAPRTFFSCLLRSLSCILARLSTSLAKPLTPLFFPAPFLILASSPKPLPMLVEERLVELAPLLLWLLLLLAVDPDTREELVVARRSKAGTLKVDEAPFEAKARRLVLAVVEDALRFRLMRSTTAVCLRRGFGDRFSLSLRPVAGRASSSESEPISVAGITEPC